jgi:cell division protein FtsW
MIGSLQTRTKGDKVIWAIVVVLTMMSLLVVYSSTGTLAYKLSKSTESYLFKQFVFRSFER